MDALSTTYCFDVVILDTVGTPISWEYVSGHPSGGTEYGLSQLANYLHKQGSSVAVISNLGDNKPFSTPLYAHFSVRQAKDMHFECKSLVTSRFTNPIGMSIKHDFHAVAAMDTYIPEYKWLRDKIEDGKTKIVCVSLWQYDLFPRTWPKSIVPAMIDDRLYSAADSYSRIAGQFVYASSVQKGLIPTLMCWQDVYERAKAVGVDVELLVTGPGYDVIDENVLRHFKGVKLIGPLPTNQIQNLLMGSEGLFYVNTFSECCPAIIAAAEAVGCRTHILALGGVAGFPEVTNGDYLTTDQEAFEQQFIEEIVKPSHDRSFKNLSVSTNAAMWEHLLLSKSHDTRKLGVVEEQHSIEQSREEYMRFNRRLLSRNARNSNKLSTVGLIMIAKDEGHCIRHTLETIKPSIDRYTIVLDSTSSPTDNTKEIIEDVFKDIPGEILYREFDNFSAQRNYAIEHAEGLTDFMWAVDADDPIEGVIDRSKLNADIYFMCIREADGSSYARQALVRSHRGVRYFGAVHEVMLSDRPCREGFIEGVVCHRTADGGSWRSPEIDELEKQRASGLISQADYNMKLDVLKRARCVAKFKRHAAMLEGDLKADPSNTRTMFYLARSYHDAGMYAEAIDMYVRRANIEDRNVEERFLASLFAGDLTVHERRGDISAWEALYRNACCILPDRAPEALYRWTSSMVLCEKMPIAYYLSRAAYGLSIPSSGFMLDPSIYLWRNAANYTLLSLVLHKHSEVAWLLKAEWVDYAPGEVVVQIKEKARDAGVPL